MQSSHQVLRSTRSAWWSHLEAEGAQWRRLLGIARRLFAADSLDPSGIDPWAFNRSSQTTPEDR
ncbi:MAG: hypothetical protein AAF004_13785 [Pseudomonadota bacterium]